MLLNLKGICNFADYFLICHGNSTRQVEAISDSIEEKLFKNDIYCNHIEGKREGLWVLMDYSDFIVHIFTREHRDFYNLERLWGDAKHVAIPPEKIEGLKPKRTVSPAKTAARSPVKGKRAKRSSRK